MKKLITTVIVPLFLVISLVGCNSEAYKEAKSIAALYNDTLAEYEKSISEYNITVVSIREANMQLDEVLQTAQTLADKGETPFDEKTLDQLEIAIKNANESMVDEPNALQSFDSLIIERSFSKEELYTICEQAKNDIEIMEKVRIPEIPSVPDYTPYIEELLNAQRIYEESVSRLKQVTKPTEEFIIQRLQLVDSIIDIEAITEEHDPNGQLNEPGGYIGCVYFSDESVDRTQLIIQPGKDNVIDVGTKGGGAIEIYESKEDARSRDAYLADFDGTIYTSGSHVIVGTCVIRTSGILAEEQQSNLTNQIIEKLLMIEQ